MTACSERHSPIACAGRGGRAYSSTSRFSFSVPPMTGHAEFSDHQQVDWLFGQLIDSLAQRKDWRIHKSCRCFRAPRGINDTYAGSHGTAAQLRGAIGDNNSQFRFASTTRSTRRGHQTVPVFAHHKPRRQTEVKAWGSPSGMFHPNRASSQTCAHRVRPLADQRDGDTVCTLYYSPVETSQGGVQSMTWE